jgi:hypothetical protein
LSDRRLWFAFSFIVALTAILSAYYWVHKPVTPEQAAALASPLADIAVAALLSLIGGGIGRHVLRRWRRDEAAFDLNLGEQVTLQAALGWGVMGLILLALGLLHLYYSDLIWALIALALLRTWREAWAWLRDLFSVLSQLWEQWFSGPLGFKQFVGAFALLVLLLSGLKALAPPVAWDALVYHLTLPKLYATTHQLKLSTDIIFTGMPQLTEMLYTAAMLLRGEIAAQLLGWMFGALLTVGLAAHASQIFKEANLAPLAPAILFSSVTLALLFSWAYADVLVMLYALAVLITLRQWRVTHEWRWLWLSGILAGFTLGVRYVGFLVLVAGVVLILLTSYGRGVGVRLLAAATFAGITLLVFIPWLIKNWIFTGSPVYPLLLPAGNMDSLRLWFYNRPDLLPHDLLGLFRAALIFPRATFMGVQGGNDYDVTLGPLFMLLGFGLVLGWHRLEAELRRELWPLTLFILISYLGWVALNLTSVLALQSRLFFFFFPALALVCAGGFAAIRSLDTALLRLSFIAQAVLLLALGLTALELVTTFATHSPLAYDLGLQTAEDYRAANLGQYAVLMDRLNTLGPRSRIKFLWEARSLECNPQIHCEPDVVIDRWWHLRRTLITTDAILAAWQAEGVTQVLIYNTGLDFVRDQADNGFTDADWLELEALRSRMQFLEDIGGTYSLYAVQ